MKKDNMKAEGAGGGGSVGQGGIESPHPTPPSTPTNTRPSVSTIIKSARDRFAVSFELWEEVNSGRPDYVRVPRADFGLLYAEMMDKRYVYNEIDHFGFKSVCHMDGIKVEPYDGDEFEFNDTESRTPTLPCPSTNTRPTVSAIGVKS